MSDGHVSKKRKKNRDGGGGPVLKLPGNKVISLDGFLNGVQPKTKGATENGQQEDGTRPSTTGLAGEGSKGKPTLSAASGKAPLATRPKSGEAGLGGGQKRRHGHGEKGALSSKRGAAKVGERGKETGDPALLPVRQALPIWECRDTIRSHLREQDVLVLVGETGSGKSTQVPQFLADEPWCKRNVVPVRLPDGREEQRAVGGVIAITQPRRVAATTLAHRVSREAGTPLRSQKAPASGALESEPKDGEESQQRQRGHGGLVGYSVRFDHNVPKGTKIKFLTEGMLLQEILHDPSLRQYSAVIVDEVHERSIDVDLVCGFLKQILQSPDKPGRGGVPLKIVAMSATADIETLEKFFALSLLPPPTPLSSQAKAAPPSSNRGEGDDDKQRQQKHQSQQEKEEDQATTTSEAATTTAPVLRIEGRQFPVQIIHSPDWVPDISEAVLKTVFKIHCGEPLPGDILVFLYGQEQIEQTQRLIEEYAATLPSDVPRITPLPLYGQLSIEAQHVAFRPLKGSAAGSVGVRKVVLATNIAETSVTVPGVRYVVDAGKAKMKQFRPLLGLESLLITPISKSSAVQRAGRAGREAPGKCYRLYTEAAYADLRDADAPEILRNDVLDAILVMKARGVDDLFSFPLLDTPKVAYMEKALVHLHVLSALDDDGAITALGRKMARLPVSAPLGRVLLAAADPAFDCLLEAIDVISIISAGDELFQQLSSHEEEREDGDERDENEDENETTATTTAGELRRELHRPREGDLLTYLTVMQRYTAEHADRTEWCRARRISARTLRQALSIRRQLRQLCVAEALLAARPPPDPQPFVPCPPARAEALTKAFLKGFVLRTALLSPDASYVTTQGKHVVAVHPSSVLHGRKREAIMFLEHVFTQKNYAKKVAVVQAAWIAEVLEGKW